MSDWESKRAHATALGMANRAALSAAAEVVIERERLGDAITFSLDGRIAELKKALFELQKIGPIGR